MVMSCQKKIREFKKAVQARTVVLTLPTEYFTVSYSTVLFHLLNLKFVYGTVERQLLRTSSPHTVSKFKGLSTKEPWRTEHFRSSNSNNLRRICYMDSSSLEFEILFINRSSF